jgi:hypothetical protein
MNPKLSGACEMRPYSLRPVVTVIPQKGRRFVFAPRQEYTTEFPKPGGAGSARGCIEIMSHAVDAEGHLPL